MFTSPDPAPEVQNTSGMKGSFWCSRCRGDTLHAVLAAVNSRESFADGDEFILHHHLTLCCEGCKTIGFCHASRNSMDEEFDERGNPYLVEQRVYYPDQVDGQEFAEAFVSEARIEQLRALPCGRFDASKLAQLLVELNAAYGVGAVYTTAILLRAIIDHVPPLFAQKSFAEVANNYPGPKSFKAAAKHLDGATKNIADGFLHQQIRGREALPTLMQVEFRADLDNLLGEVVRLLELTNQRPISDSP